MLDPLLGLGAMAIALLTVPAAPALDPGPSPECPPDMRLVKGVHADEVQHLCVKPQRDARDTHCFEYWEGLTAEEGARTEIAVCMDQFEAPNQRGAKPFVMTFTSRTRISETGSMRSPALSFSVFVLPSS